MKKISYLIFLIGSNFLFCQNIESYADYSFTRVKNGFTFNAEGKLFVNKNNQSIFVLSQYRNLLTQNSINKNGIFVANSSYICLDEKSYFSDYRTMITKSLLFENSCDSKMIVSDEIQVPEWKIYPEKLKINRHIVQKAEALINDRKWIVYFNPQINNLANPWKFYGLKGLLIKAEDENKEYFFEITSFSGKINRTLEFDIKKYPTTSFTDYKKLTISEYKTNITENVREIAASEEALQEFISKIPPYECLEFIEQK